MGVEVSLFDNATGPQPGHQFVLADDLAVSLGQGTQDAKRTPVNPHPLTIAPQFGAPKIEPKRAEADLLVLYQIRLNLCAIPNSWIRSEAGQICQPITAARDSNDKTVPLPVFV